ncbi:hypothetical protein [Corallococcus exercitus]|uniref:hypothetical protein n=1 Tax=Corallococcus exercitus TaxID=2316736 RepID=UPI0035D45170
MPPFLKSRASGLAAAALCLSACSDGPDVYALRFNLDSNLVRALRDPAPDPEYLFESPDGVTFHVASATSTLVDLRLELPPDVRCADYEGTLSPLMTCEDAAEGQPGRLTVPGPLTVDWKLGLTREAAGLRIPRGVYPRIEARLKPGTPDRPSFSARSSFTWRGQPHELAVDFQSDAVLRFEPRGGEGSLDFASAGDGSVLLGWLFVNRWLGETRVAACLESGDLTLTGNTLRLETGRGVCEGAADRMRAGIEGSAAMGLSPHP